MANFSRGFAEGFNKSYDSSSISKGMIEGAKDRKARAEFERWSTNPKAQDIMEQVGYKPHEGSTLEEVKMFADLATTSYNMGTKARTQRTNQLTDYASGMGQRPPAEAMRQFAVQPQQAVVSGQQVPVAPPGISQAAMQQNAFGSAIVNPIEQSNIRKSLETKPDMSYGLIDTIAKQYIKSNNYEAVRVIECLKAKGLSPDDIMSILINEGVLNKEEAKGWLGVSKDIVMKLFNKD